MAGPSYKEYAPLGVQIPANLAPYFAPQEVNFDKDFQIAQQAAQQQMVNESNAIKLQEQQELQEYEDGLKAMLQERNTTRDPNVPWKPEEDLSLVEKYAINNGQWEQALKIHDALKTKDTMNTMTDADRIYLDSMGMEVPAGVSKGTFGIAGNLINSGILRPNLRKPGGVEAPVPGEGKYNKATDFDISVVPRPLQKKAVEEIGALEQLEKGKEVISAAYDDIGTLGFWEENIPFTDGYATSDASRGSIESTVQANWKGPMSVSDRKSVAGLIPTSRDSPTAVQIKKQKLLLLLENNAKSTPTLDYYQPGIRKPLDSEGLYKDNPGEGNDQMAQGAPNEPVGSKIPVAPPSGSVEQQISAHLPPGAVIRSIKKKPQ